MGREQQRKAEIKYYYTHRTEINKRKREREKANPEHYAKLRKKYYFQHRDKILQHLKENRKELNEKQKIRIKKRRLTDQNYATKIRLRCAFKSALKRYGKSKYQVSKKYGIDWNKIINTLLPFPGDLSKYEIDHIIPLGIFNLTKLGEIKIAFAPENHQWLLKEKHKIKTRYDNRFLIRAHTGKSNKGTAMMGEG